MEPKFEGWEKRQEQWRRLAEWEAEYKLEHALSPVQLRSLAVETWEIAKRVNPSWGGEEVEAVRLRLAAEAEAEIARIQRSQ